MCPLTEQEFLDAMVADPGDVRIRFQFADWLEERGDPRSHGWRTISLTPIADTRQPKWGDGWVYGAGFKAGSSRGDGDGDGYGDVKGDGRFFLLPYFPASYRGDGSGFGNETVASQNGDGISAGYVSDIDRESGNWPATIIRCEILGLAPHARYVLVLTEGYFLLGNVSLTASPDQILLSDATVIRRWGYGDCDGFSIAAMLRHKDTVLDPLGTAIVRRSHVKFAADATVAFD